MRNFLSSGHGHGGPLLSSSPRTVLCRFLLFVDHVDNARGWRRGERTKARRGLGVNDLGDGGAVMRALRCSQPWEAEAGGPAGASLVLAAGGRHY